MDPVKISDELLSSFRRQKIAIELMRHELAAKVATYNHEIARALVDLDCAPDSSEIDEKTGEVTVKPGRVSV